MKKAEIILSLLALTLVILGFLNLPFLNMLMVIVFSSLAVFYMVFSVALFNQIPLKEAFKVNAYRDHSSARIFGSLGTGFAFANILVGILFKIQIWPGSDNNILIGLGLLFIIFIFAFLKFREQRTDFYRRIFKRMAFIGGFGLLVYLFPTNTWIKIKYREQPEIAKALIDFREDPNDANYEQLMDALDRQEK